MINILGYVRGSGWDDMDAVDYYRCYLPLREVNRHDNDIAAQIITTQQVKEDNPSDDELGGRDIYVHGRTINENCEVYIEEVHRRGGAVVMDSDDDLTETYRLVSGRGEKFKHVLSQIDYVTCTTPALAELFAQYTRRPPVVLRNHVDVDWLAKAASKSKRLTGGLTIGFSGSPTHWGDWYLPAIPFAQIAREYKDEGVVPLLHGETPRYLDHAAPEILKFQGVPFSIYPVILSQFDILLCAVDASDKFNAGKSAVKALEAMAVGAVPICSQFDPYIRLAEEGAPIVLVQEESREGWYAAMRRTVEDTEWRESLRDAGAGWVRANRDMTVLGHKQWAEFYRSIVT